MECVITYIWYNTKFSRVAVTVYMGTPRKTFPEQGHVSGIVVEILHVTVIQS